MKIVKNHRLIFFAIYAIYKKHFYSYLLFIRSIFIKYTFEVGGKTKTFNQIKDISNSFVVADDIEIGHKNKIPLWIFGMLY